MIPFQFLVNAYGASASPDEVNSSSKSENMHQAADTQDSEKHSELLDEGEAEVNGEDKDSDLNENHEDVSLDKFRAFMWALSQT